ncbi:hypothetical protein WDW37_14270 [Bdellovibrionota bacterium FG-1]
MKSRFNSPLIFISLASLLSLSLQGCGSSKSSDTPALSDSSSPTPASQAQSAESAKSAWKMPDETSDSAKLSSNTRSLITALSSDANINRFSPPAYVMASRYVKELAIREGQDGGFSGEQAFQQLIPTSSDPSTSLQTIQTKQADAKFAMQLPIVMSANQSDELRSLVLQPDRNGAAFKPFSTIDRLALGAAAEASRLGVAEVIQEWSTYAEGLAKSFLATRLQELSGSELQQWESFLQTPPDQVEPILSHQVQKWVDEIPVTMDNPERVKPVKAAIFNYLFKASLEQIRSQQTLQDFIKAQGNSNTNEISHQLAGIAKTFVEFSDVSQEHLNSIKKQQTEIQAGLKKLEEEAATEAKRSETSTPEEKNEALSISGATGFLNQFLSGQKTLQEMEDYLTSQKFKKMPKDLENKIEEKINLISKAKGVEAKVGNLLNGAEDLVNIAKTFGLPENITQMAQKGIDLGNQAATAVQSILEGNMIKAAGSVLGMLGIGGPDIAQQRQEQVMKGLGAIQNGQKEILNGEKTLALGENMIMSSQQELLEYNKTILDNQKSIIQNQKATFEGLQQLSIQADEGFNKIQTSLDALHIDVKTLIELVENLSKVEIVKCDAFFDARKKVSHGYDEQLSLFVSFGGFEEHFNHNLDEFNKCNSGLTSFINTPNWASNFLKLSRVDETKNQELLKKVYRPTLALMNQSRTATDTLSQLSLMMPPRNLSKLVEKELILAAAEKLPSTMADSVYNPSLLAEPLVVEEIIKDVRSWLSLYFYSDFSPIAGQGLSDLNQLLQARPTEFLNSRSQSMFSNALKLVNLGIAQESIISGDNLVDQLYRRFPVNQAVDCSDPAGKNWEKPLCVLEHNSYLAENLVKYGIKQDLEKSGSNLLIYDYAKAMQLDASTLRSITSNHWNFVRDGDHWAVAFGKHNVKLPSSIELQDDQVVYRAQMSELLSLRDQLTAVMLEVNTQPWLSQDLKRDLYYLLLKSL